MQINARIAPCSARLRPFEKEVDGVRSVAADDTLEYLRANEDALGYMAGVSDTSLMGRWVLSHLGPAGPLGPLGRYGPFGEGETGNVSELITGHNWEDLQQRLTRLGGPLSDKGPLSEHGPLGEKFLQRLLRMNQATWSLMPGQPLGVLGPGGVDGPLGIMGPLGPNGAHGFRATESGDYVDSEERVVRKLDVVWSDGVYRERQLFEILPEEGARGVGDTTFMVRGAQAEDESADTFRFKTTAEEWVTIHAVPGRSQVEPTVLKELIREVQFKGRRALTSERLEDWNRKAEDWFDRFQLEVLDAQGKVLADSHTSDGPNWVQVKLPAETEFQVRLRCNNQSKEEKPYRLFVTGSGPETHDFEEAREGPH